MKDVIASDFHIPYHDEKSVNMLINYLKDEQWDRLIINGDLVDLHPISKYGYDPFRFINLNDEIKQAKELLTKFREIANTREIIYIYGNHEYRFDVFFQHNVPMVSGLHGMKLSEQLELDRLNIKFINQNGKQNYFDAGNYLVGHWNVARKYSGNTARVLFDKYHRNLIQGHVHRLSLNYRTVQNKTFYFSEDGCMCSKFEQGYDIDPDWQNGFVVVDDNEIELFFIG